jgi:hypothetical protein
MGKLTVAHKGADAEVATLYADALVLNGASVVTALLLASGQVVDLNGEADALVFDAAQNVRMDGNTVGTLNIKISGATDFAVTANTFTAVSGSTIATNTIAETTAASGVTIDGVLLKDGGAVFADAATIEIDTVNEATNAAGVTVDGVLIKDTAVYGRTPVLAISADGAVTIPAYNMHYFFTKAGVAAMTIADPTAGTHDGVTLTFVATAAQANTLSNAAGSGFWSSGGAGKDVATWGGAIGDGLTIIAYQGKWYVDPRGTTNITLG